MPVISIPFALGSTAASAVHPADTKGPALLEPCTAALSALTLTASRRGVSAVHGVDVHFAFVPPPTGTGPDWTASSSIGIGFSMAAVRRAADGAVLPVGVPVITVSVTTA
jgi:hypothetical protein